MSTPMLRLPGIFSAALLGASLLAGCPNHPVQDDFRSEGGISPDPTGAIEGSILYLGPRPTCEYEGGKAKRVRGRVIMTMFVYDNPPPPEGRATTAKNLFALAGDKLFELSDCLPEGAEPDLKDRIMRSVAFRWPQIELADAPVDYQIRGFYDYDEDMNPFFRVSNLPTAGDIAGAALASLEDRSKGLLRIGMPARNKARDGHVKTGVTVVLGNYVWTERPLFKLSEQNRQLSAEEPLPVAVSLSLEPRVPETVTNIWELSCDAPGTQDCGFALESFRESEDGPALKAAKLELDFDPLRYAFYVQDVDIKTIVPNGPDLNQPDGLPDPHPLLGATLPIPFSLPAVVMQRLPLNAEQGAIEAQARIPAVSLVGTLMPSEIATQRVFLDKMNVAIPPIAVVELDPNNPMCRVPYVPPGNRTPSYEDRLAYCHDMPTGEFGVSVLHGVSGGLPAEVDESVSPTGIVIQGGGLSGQSWSIPNELGDPVQVGAENVLEHQGDSARFIVHDPHPDEMASCAEALDEDDVMRPIKHRGLCQAGDSPLVESPGRYGTLPGVDGIGCLAQACCDAVAHLCGVPLCEVVERGELKLKVRSGPTQITGIAPNGAGIPNCVPFEIPTLCCQ